MTTDTLKRKLHELVDSLDEAQAREALSLVERLTGTSAGGNGSDDPVVADALARVVNSIHPLKVILFGSRARGDARKNSDIDFLVVVPDGADHSRAYLDGYRSLIGLLTPVDLVLIDESQAERQRNDRFSVVFAALREGKLVYAA